jgi:hypothetical protein
MAGLGFAVLVGGTAFDVGVAIKLSVLEARTIWLWSVELPTIRAPKEGRIVSFDLTVGVPHTPVVI